MWGHWQKGKLTKTLRIACLLSCYVHMYHVASRRSPSWPSAKMVQVCAKETSAIQGMLQVCEELYTSCLRAAGYHSASRTTSTLE